MRNRYVCFCQKASLEQGWCLFGVNTGACLEVIQPLEVRIQSPAQASFVIPSVCLDFQTDCSNLPYKFC